MAFYNEPDKTEEIKHECNEKFWAGIDINMIADKDVLMLALDIKTNGYPSNPVIRAAILNRFNKHSEGDYYLEYEKLCNYCSDFEEAYPLDKILYLIKATITNMQNYIIDINRSSLTNEEKALLYFVLPI